ncbi:MAG: chloramphenicol acetyltransferase [Clostridia bacterium]|nr:chloramphenicol acetyltransferase [Clostridia bacterium]
MKQDKKPEKQLIDLTTWSRRDNFEFFRDFYNPNLGVTVRVDVRHAYAAAKAKGVSFFMCYFYAILSAVNEIREFRYRFDREGNIVCYDRIDGLAPIRVEEKDNFAEMVFPYTEDFDTFCKTAQQIKALAASIDPYELADAMTDYNVILVSALPKLDFSSFCNTQRDRCGNDYPLCVVGKMGEDKTMPISITVHHGFADGEHIARFFELLQEKLNQLYSA